MMSYEQFLLMKLSEEASEISQIALKTMQFGMEEQCPGLLLNNKERIHEELNDLYGIIDMLNTSFNFNYEINKEAVKNKKIKVLKYLEYSKNLGMVSGS